MISNLKMFAIFGLVGGFLASSPGQQQNPPAKQTSPADPTQNNPDVPHQEPGTNNPDLGKQRRSTSTPDSDSQQSSSESSKGKKSRHRKTGKTTDSSSQTSS